jgi:hypothetical protein
MGIPLGLRFPGDGDGRDDGRADVRRRAVCPEPVRREGTAKVTVDDQMTVHITSSGVLAGMPHAQHVHQLDGGAEGSCPPASADDNGDGFISTGDGQPSYGAIRVSLTTEGDVSADSGLAVERFPTAPDGSVSYERTFDVPAGLDVENLDGAVIVQHGIDVNGNGEYDMEGVGARELNPELPGEATFPALCGALTQPVRVASAPASAAPTASRTPA